MSSLTKAAMAEYLAKAGLKVEGDETRDELLEAYRYMRAYQGSRA